MLPLRIFRLTASRRLLPAISTSSFSTSYRYRADAKDVDPAQPHLPNRASTLGNDMPKVGFANAPPEFLGKVDPNYTPVDSGSGKGQQGEVSGAKSGGHETEVNDTDWSTFRHEPLERKGEDEKTMRARLVYQSRKRGILETDLLLSTFADAHLPSMTQAQMSEYDKFLDENDWDIYYWCTQDAPPESVSTPAETIKPASPSTKTASPTFPNDKIGAPPGALGMGSIEQPAHDVSGKGIGLGGPQSGEWAQTIGTVKQPYRPVPEKWASSEILSRLRGHVDSRKATGKEGETGKGMGRMPDMKTY